MDRRLHGVDMDFEDIKKVNETLRTTDIKGKDYVEVNERIKAFRMLIPDGTIETHIIEDLDGICTIKAIIRDSQGKVLATGHAQEKENSTFINKTSYVENCETSAVGRALGMLGIGIDTSIASAEEVGNAMAQQETKQMEEVANSKIDAKKVKVLKSKLEADGIPLDNILKPCKVNRLEDLSEKQFSNIVNGWEKVKAWKPSAE